MDQTENISITHFAIHLPGEHPSQGFQSEQEAKAFIRGYAFGCGHDGKDKPCSGALAEWIVERPIA